MTHHRCRQCKAWTLKAELTRLRVCPACVQRRPQRIASLNRQAATGHTAPGGVTPG